MLSNSACLLRVLVGGKFRNCCFELLDGRAGWPMPVSVAPVRREILFYFFFFFSCKFKLWHLVLWYKFKFKHSPGGLDGLECQLLTLQKYCNGVVIIKGHLC